jgi:hypothetical protein
MRQKANKTIKPKLRKKRPVPTFGSQEEEAAFWQQHSSEDFVWEDLPEPFEIDEALKKQVRQRSERRRRRLVHGQAPGPPRAG